jgi:hypothetical protein
MFLHTYFSTIPVTSGQIGQNRLRKQNKYDIICSKHNIVLLLPNGGRGTCRRFAYISLCMILCSDHEYAIFLVITVNLFLSLEVLIMKKFSYKKYVDAAKLSIPFYASQVAGIIADEILEGRVKSNIHDEYVVCFELKESTEFFSAISKDGELMEKFRKELSRMASVVGTCSFDCDYWHWKAWFRFA